LAQVAQAAQAAQVETIISTELQKKSPLIQIAV
jgi:hypothetical protein